MQSAQADSSSISAGAASPPADASTSSPDSSAELSAIASTLAESMPEPQEHAIKQAEDQQRETENAPADKSGARFDPAIHVTGSDGKPVTTARGTFALKRGRKAGNATASKNVANGGSVLAGAQKPADVQKAALAAQSRAAGEGAAELLFMAGRIVGGEEWLPMLDPKTGLDERAMMRGAFGDYFVATNKSDVPPGAVLGFALLAYIAPRFGMPKTRERFGGIKRRITQWWINRKLRKQGLTVSVKPSESAT